MGPHFLQNKEARFLWRKKIKKVRIRWNYNSFITLLENILCRDGDVIFIKTDFTKDFVMGPLADVKTRQCTSQKTIRKWTLIDLFSFRFIVVTHNSDFSVPRHSQDQNLLDNPLLIRWFAQNINPKFKDHMKMEAIPLGLENPNIRNYQISDIEPHLR